MAVEFSVSINEGLLAEPASLASDRKRSQDELVSVAVRRLVGRSPLMAQPDEGNKMPMRAC